jgi:hypothetical protein
MYDFYLTDIVVFYYLLYKIETSSSNDKTRNCTRSAAESSRPRTLGAGCCGMSTSKLRLHVIKELISTQWMSQFSLAYCKVRSDVKRQFVKRISYKWLSNVMFRYIYCEYDSLILHHCITSWIRLFAYCLYDKTTDNTMTGSLRQIFSSNFIPYR